MSIKDRLPCRITDSIPYAELTSPYDEDEAYERMAQEDADDAYELREAIEDIATPALGRFQVG